MAQGIRLGGSLQERRSLSEQLLQPPLLDHLRVWRAILSCRHVLSPHRQNALLGSRYSSLPLAGMNGLLLVEV